MPASQTQPHYHLVLTPTFPAERRDLLRLFVVSALAHAVALIMLVIWGGDGTRFPPPPRVITVDLSRIQPQSLPRLADARLPKPAQRPAMPAPVRPVKAVKPQPATAAAKPRPAAPGRTAPAAMPAAASRETVRWGIPATPSGAPSEIPSGSLLGVPSGKPPGTTAPVSAGAAGTATATRPVAAPSSTSSGQTADRAGIRSGYIRQCRALIERNKEYPVMARKGMIEGTVMIRGKLARDGALQQCIVTRSSGSGLLDNAAMRAVRGVGRFPPLPAEIEGSELVFELPVSFKLSSE